MAMRARRGLGETLVVILLPVRKDNTSLIVTLPKVCSGDMFCFLTINSEAECFAIQTKNLFRIAVSVVKGFMLGFILTFAGVLRQHLIKMCSQTGALPECYVLHTESNIILRFVRILAQATAAGIYAIVVRRS